ncbi:ornithine cyclodeaminase family protein [Actinomadura rupiterrae]|uniref:ornithine cyclodeaminase family protein n=1 Tax=Actinomadura rupiterrae TaxID=559627 RepID=UPI0020A619FF|nr:ornithine cyclodeaminase family protein [Actinomadura rupiterrae]MCP2340485.1 ornithine cyclodeaminase/alanine dehydrogenase-like protein (mu-crystallin family) [Actinomadura rupiterrae]
MIVLSQQDVEELLDVEALVDALAPAMADLSAGRAAVPARTAALVPEADALLLDMPGYAPSAELLISKLVSVFPGNAGNGLPVRQAVIVAFDAGTGEPVAFLDGTHITATRTAACAVLSARLLARPDASVAAVFGTGPQARAHIRALPFARSLREIRVAGRDFERTRAFAAEMSGDVPVRAMASYEEACDGADIVCGATYADEPVIRRAWLAPGTHVTSIGYNPRGRELDDATVADASLFVESRTAALEAVPPNLDLAEPIERGLITADHVRAELGEVIEGTHPGRTTPDEITLYKSVGVITQDIAAVSLVLAAARTLAAG